jgi:hypothetical protein
MSDKYLNPINFYYYYFFRKKNEGYFENFDRISSKILKEG